MGCIMHGLPVLRLTSRARHDPLRIAEALTLGHRAGLPSNGTGGPDLPQRIAKDCREVIGVCGLVPARSQALLLHAFQEAIGR